mgnify:CR=1 FL=1
MKNYGIDIQRELNERSPEDYSFGSLDISDIAAIPEYGRNMYYPFGEIQKNAQFDTMDCASRAPVNILEMKFNFALNHGLLRQNEIAFLKDNGYIISGKVQLSDRFIAVLSGTTIQGNSLKSPLQAIHEHGLIPKSKMPFEPWMTWDDYYNKEEVEKYKGLGQESLSLFSINYTQVPRSAFNGAIKDDPIIVAGYAWPEPVNGLYSRTELPFNHAFTLASGHFNAYDNYTDSVDNDYEKLLAPNYSFFDYGYDLYLNRTGMVVKKKKPFLTRIKIYMGL